MGKFILIFWVVGAFLSYGLLARLIAALFSWRSRLLIKQHRIWHFAWVLIVIVYWILVVEIPGIEHKIALKAQLAKIRENVHAAVEQTGGWNALRSETRKLTDEKGPETQIAWFFEAREHPEYTNAFPLISKLHPWEIYFRKNTTNEGYVFVEVFHGQWGGGRSCTRYYYLMLTPTNYDEFPSSFIPNGDKAVKITNSVYEVTWQF